MFKALPLAIAAGLLWSGPAAAENLNFNFLNPNFGGNPDLGVFLFGLAEAQLTGTVDPDEVNAAGGGGTAPIDGIGGGDIGGPTIIIPVGDLGPDGVPNVDVGE
mgnify:CR=1 FL=1